MTFEYDVIVVGAGHAGCEAACASANLGCKTLLITLDLTKIAAMSCNPAIGGIAKGQIVREIDALGGYTGIITDKSSIQFRMLNQSKGAAMWSPRSQCDKTKFSLYWRQQIEHTDNLFLWQDSVDQLLIENGVVCGVHTLENVNFRAKAVVLTAGTFLNGLIHIGSVNYAGGRMADASTGGINEQLCKLGVRTDRMKTGTPVRIDGRTINFTKMTEQPAEDNGYRFSYLPINNKSQKQLSCYITYTNPTVHKILHDALPYSPLFNGTIKSKGPRYCPSIETKIVNFSDKERHQLFLEPEGTDTVEYYLNGFSSSLPLDVQFEAIKNIEGLEDCYIYRPGYAIEYDYFDPTQLERSLESKVVKNLFLAGQVNGTTGYEEAAGQGLIAGINAARKIANSEPFILRRDEAYIGVLIDDLVTKGVDEPYRMFTSRAEFRILLRQDNADERLTPIGRSIGLVKDDRYNHFLDKQRRKKELHEYLAWKKVTPEASALFLEKKGTDKLQFSVRLSQLLARPQITIYDLVEEFSDFRKIVDAIPNNLRNEVLDSVEIDIKYAGYIDREKQNVEKINRLEYIKLRGKIDYNKITALSFEAREKLVKIDPENINQARRIPGVSPADISILLVLLGH